MTETQKERIATNWNWVRTDSPAFSKALDLILNTDRNMTIIGPGGVGKSILLKMAADLLPGNTVVLSTTGVSAANLAGEGLATTTIHSFYRLPPVAVIDEPQVYSDLVDVMQSVDTILIDEVSMLNAAVMDTILSLTRRYRTFCAKQLPRFIFFGDVLQLPPVVDERDQTIKHHFERKYDGKIMFYHARNYKTLNCVVIALNEIYRQTDTLWKDILCRIRLGECTEQDLARINKQVIKEDEYIKKHDMMMYLVATNAKVNTINDFYMDDDNAITYTAKIVGKFNTNNTNLQTEITIAPGMQVIATHNNKDLGYQNGTIGRVLYVAHDHVSVKTNKGDVIHIGMETWNQYKYVYDSERDVVAHEIVGEFKQIGCKPAFAATIHKSQGLTLDYVLLDPTELKYMSPGLAYVALSRCTSLQGLGLTRPLKLTDIKVFEEGLEFIKESEYEN